MAKGQKTGGRQKGSVNKVTADIKALAQSYGPAGIRKLVMLAGLEDGFVGADSDAAKIAAIKEIFDRAYGKSAQPATGEGGEGNPIVEVIYRWEK